MAVEDAGWLVRPSVALLAGAIVKVESTAALSLLRRVRAECDKADDDKGGELHFIFCQKFLSFDLKRLPGQIKKGCLRRYSERVGGKQGYFLSVSLKKR